MSDLFRLADDLGPEKIVHLYDPETGLQGVLAIDNVALGPGIGGIRLAPDVTAEEAFRLARAMTLKSAAAGLPHGGCKSVIRGDPAMPLAQKERTMRTFGRLIAPFTEYIPGPDMGTDERCMVWVKEEAGRAIGLPADHGGIPLDEIGVTGLGVAVAAEVAAGTIGLDLAGARVVVQGFGAVGRHAARFLCRRGALLVGVADISGAIYDAAGLDLDALFAHAGRGGVLADFAPSVCERDDIVGFACDIWIPAARPDVITKANVDRLDTRLVVQGANIPVSPDAERALHQRGVLSVPDFIANAGGLISGAVELNGGTAADALSLVERKIRENTTQVLAAARARRVSPREAAVDLARERVLAAMRPAYEIAQAAD